MPFSGKCLLLLSALLLAAFGLAGRAEAAQPFAMPGAAGGDAAPQSTQAPSSQAEAGSSSVLSFVQKPIAYAMAAQQSYYRAMARSLRAVNLDRSLAAAWTLISISFAYGIFHAVGPGHGKVVVTSYLLAGEREVKRGILIAFLASFMQALTAITVVGALAILLGLTHRAVADAVPPIERGSFLLITGVGAWMFWRALRPGGDHGHAHEHHDHVHEHGHDDHGHHDHGHHDHGHAHLPTPAEVRAHAGWRGMAAMVLAVGLRPCTGAILVLLFALTQGAFAIGALSALAVSLGTAITVSTLAVLTVFSKNLALRLADATDNPWGARIERGLKVAGGLFIFLMGLFLLTGSLLAPAQPLL